MSFNFVKADDIVAKYPLYKYEHKNEREGYLISKSGDVSRLLEVKMPQIYASSASELGSFHNAWCMALNCLPSYTVVHKQDYFLDGVFQDEASEDDPILKKFSAKYFNGKKYIRHKCVVTITMASERSLSNNYNSNYILRGTILPPSSYKEERLRDFDDAVSQFTHILRQSGFNLRELSYGDLVGDQHSFGLLDQYLSLNFSGKAEILNDLHHENGSFMVGDNIVSCFAIDNLKSMPDEVFPAIRKEELCTDHSEVATCYVSDICMGLSFNHIYNQIFFIGDSKKIFSDLEKDIKRMESFSTISRENAINRDYNEAFLNEAHASGKKPIYFTANIMTWDTNKQGLLEKNSQIASALALLGCEAVKVEGVVATLYWACIPGACANYPFSEEKCLTFIPEACAFINTESNYRDLCGEDRVGLKLTDRQYGVPVIVDVSNYPMEAGLIDNKNKFVLGSSGSGKSFFTNLMVSQKYMAGDHIVIVDVGDSYQTLCALINEETRGNDGIYFTYKDNEPIEFNPFYVGEDYVYGEEKMMSLCSLIQAIWKNADEKFNNNEITQLRTGMQNYVQKICTDRSIRPCFNTFYEYMRDEYRLIIEANKVRIENFDIDNFLQVLAPYYKGGTYDYLLNSTTNTDLQSKRFVVFELDNIKDNKVLFPVVTLIIMDTFISKMRYVEASTRKMMLIEEAWKAISQAGMAEFIKYLYKTVRKHNGEVAVVTQEPDDLMDNPIVKDAIINSADVKILLDLSKFANRFDKIKNALALSDKDAALALSVNKMVKPPFKEVFISFNGKFSSVYRVETSKGEALSFTSKKEEKAEIYALKKTYGSMRKAIIESLKRSQKK